MAAHRLLGFLILLNYFLLLHSAANDQINNKCQWSFHCQKLGLVLFPFTENGPECGLRISGCDNPDEEKGVHFENQTYKIESIFQDGHNSFFILETNTTISFWEVPMMSLRSINRVSFLRKGTNCYGDHDDQAPMNMSLYKSCPPYNLYYNSEHDVPQDDMYPSLSTACSNSLPDSTDRWTSLRSFVEIEVVLSESSQEFYFQWRLNDTGSHDVDSYENKGVKGWTPQFEKIGLSIGLAVITTIALCAIILLLYRRRPDSSDYQNKTRNIYSNANSNTIPESGNVYFGIPVFSYEELQEATNNFDQARELGEGGFGTVYYGKLRDGREVAVKRLYERNYRPVESFINEVQILTRLRHRNLVSLFGCTSRHSRELLLVYEYVPNGTVSYHLHSDKSNSKLLLPWPVRMKIAIETATALVYLHASDIIHRDVKTSNILLENNFGVKVADFGLSRLFPDDVTHISTAPRGTPGYVDPDYRLCYQLTSKSDVYSFGVVLVELISSLPAVDMNREQDDIKLANLAIKKIQTGAFCELGDPNLGFESDDRSRRMMISVAKLAFQCLQGDKDLRPSMSEVLEVLQRIESDKDEPGNLEGIEVHGASVSLSNSHPLVQHTLMKPKRLHQTH